MWCRCSSLHLPCQRPSPSSYNTSSSNCPYKPVSDVSSPCQDKKRKNTNVFGQSSIRFILFTIVGPLLLAVLLIIGHHFYYDSLDGEPDQADDSFSRSNVKNYFQSQTGAQAAGNAFAFAIKACLTSAIGTAFIQLTWRLVKDQACTVSALDAMWNSQTDPLAFANLGFWKAATVLVAVPLVAWALPVMALFPSSSLTIRSVADTRSATCLVPNFDLTNAADAFYNG